MQTTFLYTLSDPETGKIRYLGKSNNPFKRFKRHLKDREPSYKTNWISGLKTKGLVPYMDLLDEVPETQWKFWEREYIRVFRAIGIPLTNQCDGGEEPPNFFGRKHSQATRDKISEANKGSQHFLGKKHSEATLEKMRKNHKGNSGKKASEATREKMRAAAKRRPPISQETRDKMSAAASGENNPSFGKSYMKGRKFSDKARQNMRAAAILREKKKRGEI